MEDNAEFICSLFKNSNPCLIGRNGSLELEVILFFTTHRSNGIDYPYALIQKLELHAGIFPATYASVDAWCKAYIGALKECSAIVEGWYKPLANKEMNLHNTLIPEVKRILLRNLEPYYFEPKLRWSKYLKEKKVAIINSFAETCEQQTYMANAIWGDTYESILPSSTHWIPIQTYYSPALAQGIAGWPESIDCWEEAVSSIVISTIDSGATIAIIGCGGLGMIIGAELKRKGLQVIILGGAVQILFGIKGQRWIKHSVISTFFNDAWVAPPDFCRPNGSYKIEQGCYWYKDI